jgi:hypothetical protein
MPRRAAMWNRDRPNRATTGEHSTKQHRMRQRGRQRRAARRSRLAQVPVRVESSENYPSPSGAPEHVKSSC